MEGSIFSSNELDYHPESCLNDKLSYSSNPPPSPVSPLDRKRVRFSRTQIYYFMREQGHSSVPQRGGCSLGMAQRHFYSETYEVLQYRLMRLLGKRSHLDNFTDPCHNYLRGRRGKTKSPRVPLIPVVDSFNPGNSGRMPLFYSHPNLTPQSDGRANLLYSSVVGSTASPPCLSPSKETFFCEISADLDSTSHLETDLESSDFSLPPIVEKKLLPLHPTVRSRMLRQAGVLHIDESERLTCASLRNSRASVGCGCISLPCNSESCSCVLLGVPCQVDRPGFPCDCNTDQCGNPYGRVEFSTSRVRAHTLHVLQRLSATSNIEQTELSSERGECVFCLQERLKPQQPPSSLLSPISDFKRQTSIVSSASNSTSKSIVLYTPPIIPLPWGAFSKYLEKSESPPSADVASDSQIVNGKEDEDDDNVLLGKAVFTPAAPGQSLLPFKNPLESVRTPSAIGDKAPFGRLSLRKRRIIRSACSQTFRKRYIVVKPLPTLVFPPSRPSSLSEVDSSMKWSTQTPTSTPEGNSLMQTPAGSTEKRGVI